MAGSGRVSSVWYGNVPKTNKPATGVRIDGLVPKPGGGCQGIEFFIETPKDLTKRPVIGDDIVWNSRFATTSKGVFKKLTWELDPDRDLY